MEAGHGAGYFRDLLIFLVMAGLIVPVFHRLRINPVIGFLIGGVLVGPHGLAQFAGKLPFLNHVTMGDMHAVAPLAELGVVFLLFTIGLELSFERLSRLRRYVFGLGSAQVLGTSLVLATFGMMLGLGWQAAGLLGLALALSSTAIAIPVMQAENRLATGAGRVTFSILILQDLAVAPIMMAIAAAGASAATGGSTGLNFAIAFGSGMAVIAALVGGGRLLLRPLMHGVARSGSQELFLAACILVALGAGLIAQAAGHSMALGAFLAGLLLAETEYRHEIEVTIEPFKGLLLGLFFMTTGAQLDIGLLIARPIEVAILVFGLVGVKAVILKALLGAFRVPAHARGEIALTLAPAGEFAFVLIGQGMASQIIGREAGSLVLIAALISMFAVPSLHTLGMAIGKRRKVAELDANAFQVEPGGGAGKVLIVGFGRVGQLVADMLVRHKVPYLAMDNNPQQVARARARGLNVIYGDGSKLALLRQLGIAEARALVATSHHVEAVDRLVNVARGERPDLVIIARARDADHAAALYRAGVTDVVPETVEASLQLAENVLVDIGVPMGLVIASVHEKRDEFRAELQREGATLRPKRPNRRPPIRPDDKERPRPGEG